MNFHNFHLKSHSRSSLPIFYYFDTVAVVVVVISLLFVRKYYIEVYARKWDRAFSVHIQLKFHSSNAIHEHLNTDADAKVKNKTEFNTFLFRITISYQQHLIWKALCLRLYGYKIDGGKNNIDRCNTIMGFLFISVSLFHIDCTFWGLFSSSACIKRLIQCLDIAALGIISSSAIKKLTISGLEMGFLESNLLEIDTFRCHLFSIMYEKFLYLNVCLEPSW